MARLARRVDATTIAREAESLADRIAGGRFYVACVGQFKRGKSTLINALVGEAVLPAGVVPVTSAVTVVRYGARRAARVQGSDGRWRAIDCSELAGFVTEEHNPDNRKGVTGVEVFLPAPLLASGMCLVDTPGLGSVFPRASATTRELVPHLDAALVVVGGDPPISGEELALVEEISRQVDHVVTVMNKADRLPETERAAARSFTRLILEQRLGRDAGPVLEVSAAERLAGIDAPRDWDALRSRLAALAAGSGGHLVEAAARRGLRLLADRLLHELAERESALARPIAESERRIERLRQGAAGAERSLNDLAYLFTAEQDRIATELSRRRQAFLDRALPAAQSELAERLESTAGSGSPAYRRSLALAREIYHRWVDRFYDEVRPAAEDLYRRAAARFVDLANGFLAGLAAAGDPALAGLPREVSPPLGLRARSRLHYTELMHLTRRSPLAWLGTELGPAASRRRATLRSARAYFRRLLVTNASRVSGDLDDRVSESRRQLEAEVRSILGEISGAAQRALATARSHQAAGAESLAAEQERLQTIRQEAAALREEA